MLDRDHSKNIDDRFGHSTGDQVLVGVVDAIRRSTCGTDRIFRYGGEEFVVIFPGAPAGKLVPLLEHVCEAIRDDVHVHGQPVTASIGVAALLAHDDWRSWRARADAALYEAKREGRNNVTAPATGSHRPA